MKGIEFMSRREKNPLGQYFTPKNIAELMVNLVNHDNTADILEPCCGEGVFLDVLNDRGFNNCSAIEIDTELKKSAKYPVINTSYLSWKNPMKFDVVIGNPPYIRWKDLHDNAKQEMQSLPNWKVLFNSLSDYLAPFIAESVQRLNPNGELIFITPAFWMHTLHTRNLRDWMLNKGKITDIIDFGEARVFKGVATSVVIFKYVLGANTDHIQYHQYIGKSRIPESEILISNEELFKTTTIPQFEKGKHWTLASSETQDRISKLESPSRPKESEVLFTDDFYISLGEYVDIANGMVSGLDRAFRIPETEISSLNVQEQLATLKVIKAKDLNRFVSQTTTLYIDVPPGLSEQEFVEIYPNFDRLLSPYKAELLMRYSYDKHLPYWEWAFKRSEQFLTRQVKKGFVPCKERLTTKQNVRFSLVPDYAIATQDVTAFAPKSGVKESIEYIVAYLTLPEITEWIRSKGLMKGGVAEFSEKPLSMIPFRSIDFEDTEERDVHRLITDTMQKLSNSEEVIGEDAVESMHELLRQLIF